MLEEKAIMDLLNSSQKPMTVGEIKHSYFKTFGEMIRRCDLKSAMLQLERKGIVEWSPTDRLGRGEWPDRMYALVK